MLLVWYPRCTTCKRAKSWLENAGLKFELKDIKEENPSEADLRKWHKKSGLPLKRFFNTSGMLYREKNLKDKLPQMSEEEKYKLLATDGLLVKRPILVTDDFVLLGFKEAEWSEKLL